jgi:hypothetical protein
MKNIKILSLIVLNKPNRIIQKYKKQPISSKKVNQKIKIKSISKINHKNNKKLLLHHPHIDLI